MAHCQRSSCGAMPTNPLEIYPLEFWGILPSRMPWKSHSPDVSLDALSTDANPQEPKSKILSPATSLQHPLLTKLNTIPLGQGKNI